MANYTTDDLQVHLGKSILDVKPLLEKEGRISVILLSYFIAVFFSGYQVHEVRLGKYSTGLVPARCFTVGEEAPAPIKRIVVSYKADEPDQPICHIRRDDF